MRRYKIEKDFMVDNYRCVIIGTSTGHRCGYVGLPQGHKYHGSFYMEVGSEIDVHGGLTYSEPSEGYPIQEDDNRWWLGFDCAHCEDGIDLNLIKELNDEYTYNRIFDIEKRYPTGGDIRTTEYVEEQLFELLKQL